jgi:CobQ-like glutamine amidotransferase family enzyme
MGVLLSSSNLLKTFGVGVDVAQQLATDKALRRKATGSTAAVVTDAITGEVAGLQDVVSALQGQVVEGITIIDGDTVVPHTLGRVPAGAIVILFDDTTGTIMCSATAIDNVTISSSAEGTATVWIV